MRVPDGLRPRLLLSHLVVALAALGTVLVAVSLVGPGYFSDAMGHGPGDPIGSQMDARTLAAFGEAVRTALVAAFAIALLATITLAMALSARIAGPVSTLAGAARRIASGHYAERVPDASGEVGALSVSFNEMAASLEATERRRLELVGDVAHELRTPLATLDGYLEGLEDGVVKPSTATWSLLRGETDRLTRLVDDLSELWRAEAGQLPLRMGTTDVATVVREVAERARPVAAERGIALAVEAPPVLSARSDRNRLVQVLGNFVSNAIRYAPAGTTVSISAMPGDPVRVAVRDEGPGLTEEQTRRVFERFYRVDPSRSRALGGSGIGLPIAKAVAEAMGGRAWAESAGPGRGSTFWLALPAVSSTNAPS
ncbi:MAG TPA: HAMP domain-containing sensor histidine kinase [Candidatus Limnocylindrales bacterium]|nr:HAMP domain-containing sensor histidine kinase [Candidatus Limnocylindrales bacterium]